MKTFSVLLVCIFVLACIFAVVLCTRQGEYGERLPIISDTLGTQSEMAGNFFLFIGRIEGYNQPVYYVYAKYPNGGIRLLSCRASVTRLFLDGKNYIRFEASGTCECAGVRWIDWAEIHIPKGAIKYQFDMNLPKGALNER